MFIQNIISNKFDLNWSTTFSYNSLHQLAVSIKCCFPNLPLHWLSVSSTTCSNINFFASLLFCQLVASATFLNYLFFLLALLTCSFVDSFKVCSPKAFYRILKAGIKVQGVILPPSPPSLRLLAICTLQSDPFCATRQDKGLTQWSMNFKA
jgi:hypothetical protein